MSSQIKALEPNIVETAIKVIVAMCTVAWCVLTAQMQCGKSSTYFLVMAEKFRRGEIDRAIIFSGNNEKDLQDQTRSNFRKFLPRYSKYLVERCNYSREDALEVQLDLSNKMEDGAIRIIWSSKLKTVAPNATRTLFIWDESHAAQNIGMRPDAFLACAGICPSGDPDVLRARGNFMLSVSATPISEISDALHLKQEKTIVRMDTPANYYGIANMLESGRIKGYKKIDEVFDAEVPNFANPTWGLIRAVGDKADQIRICAVEKGWKAIEYNDKIKDIGSLSELAAAPEVPTLVFLKGMMRMGKELDKEHIQFVMETSDSKTDVTVQGLLGRVCGYHEYRDINVYLCHKFVQSDELERFQALHAGEDCIPRRAKNIKAGCKEKSKLFPIIPIKLGDFTIDGSEEVSPIDCDRVHLVEAVKSALGPDGKMVCDGRIVRDNNHPIQQTEIIDQVDNYTESQFVRHCVNRDNSYTHAAKKIYDSITNSIPTSLGSSCGIKAAGGEICMFVFEEPFPEFAIRRGDVYIVCMTQQASKEVMDARVINDVLPRTTMKEVFCTHKRETGDIVESNGAYSVHIPANSSVIPSQMLKSIQDCIRLSQLQIPLSAVVLPRFIASNPNGKLFNGLLVSDEIHASLQKDGEIYRAIFEEFGLKLQIKMLRGRLPAQLARMNMTRLSEIAW